MQTRQLVTAVLIATLLGCSRSEETAPRVVEISPEPAPAVVGPGQEPGEHIPVLNHFAGTRGGGGWMTR